jgi:hypothetical protein
MLELVVFQLSSLLATFATALSESVPFSRLVFYVAMESEVSI